MGIFSTMKWKLLFLFLIFGANLYGKQGVSTDSNLAHQQILTDQTNLALREVGHLLLEIAGNDSSTVAPIQQQAEHIFLLPISQSFNYDTLPFLLQHALENMDMGEETYYVSVKDCSADTLILGYDKRQFIARNVPCIGRHQYAECNHIFVTFPNRSSTTSTNPFYTYGSILLAFLLGGLFYWYKREVGKKEQDFPISTNNKQAQHLSFGNCQLDVTNQFLSVNGTKTALTFREAKLLHYFASNANQLLNRETILAEVWGDEGVIVGRSLDVFVSRLRKLIKEDNRLTIKTVYGVGYRLEVQK